MNAGNEDNQKMNWVKYGFAVGSFLLGYVVLSNGLLYFGNIRYGSGYEDYPLSFITIAALGFLFVGGAAFKAILAMSPHYANTSYFRIITLHFLTAALGVGCEMLIYLMF